MIRITSAGYQLWNIYIDGEWNQRYFGSLEGCFMVAWSIGK